jgi:hypothetical protein
MGRALSYAVALIAAVLLSASALAASLPAAPVMSETPIVQVKSGLAAGKLCTVVRSCNFSRRAAVRGCLSSYSCRRCDFVKRCASGRCEYVSRCGWGDAGS